MYSGVQVNENGVNTEQVDIIFKCITKFESYVTLEWSNNIFQFVIQVSIWFDIIFGLHVSDI